MFIHDNCGERHHTVTVARLCEQGLTRPCDWLVNRPLDDGSDWVVACGAAAWITPDGGFECEAGHSHVPAEVRAQQGWDYAEDPYEAGLLARQGVQPVGMDGGSIDIDPAAFHHVLAP